MKPETKRIGADDSDLASSESGLAKSERFGRSTHEEQQAREIAARDTGSWMLGVERLFAYRQRALVKRPRTRKVALVPEAKRSPASASTPSSERGVLRDLFAGAGGTRLSARQPRAPSGGSQRLYCRGAGSDP
jgi:hypothetical protein